MNGNINKRIKAGADIHAGGGGYEIGTQEKYDAFVKVRNKSLGQARIRDLAEHCDFYVGNEHYNESHEENQRLWTEKFAELIIQEAISYMNYRTKDWDAELQWVFNDGSGYMNVDLDSLLKEHFGLQEQKE